MKLFVYKLYIGERLLEVTVRQPKRQSVPVGGRVTFRCTGYSRVRYVSRTLLMLLNYCVNERRQLKSYRTKFSQIL